MAMISKSRFDPSNTLDSPSGMGLYLLLKGNVIPIVEVLYTPSPDNRILELCPPLR